MQENKIDTSSEKSINNTTQTKSTKSNWKDLLKISSLPVFIASLCCLSPIILLSLGLVTLSAATELADIFYGTYKWVFRAVGFAALVTAFIFYMRKQGVCTIDEAKRRRNEILNKLALTLIAGVLGYVFFLYLIVHYLGVFLNVWK